MAISEQNTVHHRGVIRLTGILLISLLCFAACKHDKALQVPYYTDASFTPLWQPTASQVNALHTITPFRFADQYGDTISEKTMKGKIYLANFFFTACSGICPKMTRTMLQVYGHYKDNGQVVFVSHSVTPDEDSVPRLYAYASHYGVSGHQWHFVTGNVNDIYRTARQGYFVEEEPGLSKDSTEFLHTENMILVDGKGHIRGLYNGTLEAEVPRIVADIDALLAE